MNWVDSKHSVNSVEPLGGNTEPSCCNTHKGVETRHGEPLKFCSKCNSEKPLTEFYKKDRTGRLDSTCKRCRIIAQREKTLGITDDEYWALYWKQNGRCGICHKRINSRRYKRFAVDHDHKTGKIRGLLCHQCNTALGLLKDDPLAIDRAKDWVKV